MRSDVVDALSTTHGEVVTAALADLFEESTEAHQRRNAAWLLGRVTDSSGLAIDTLVEALDDDDEMVRQFAATSLAEIGTPTVEEALLEALDTTFGEGRSMILFTLGKVGSERARQRLVRLLDEVDSLETQEQTLSALSRLGGTGS
jgi:HEAT repeat protein